MFVTVSRSPAMAMSNGKSPAAVVHSGDEALVVSTSIDVAPLEMLACNVDPSMSAWPYTRSSA